MFGGSSSGGRADRGDEVGRRERVKRAQEKIAKRKAVKDTPISDYKPSPAMARYLAKTKKEEFTAEEKLDEKCWPGYEKKGMKTMFGKRYPNCVKKKVKREEYSDWRDEVEYIDEVTGKAISMGIKAGAKQIAKRGIKRTAKRAAIKAGGKAGGKAAKKAGEVASRETKKAAVETATAVGKGASQGIKKRKERALDNIQKNTEKLFSGEVKEAVAKPKKKYGKFEKAGRVIGGIGGSIGGGVAGTAAAGAAGSVVPVAGTVAGGLAGGVAGSLAGDAAGTKTGGTIGKKIDKVFTKKKKPMVAKEENLDEFIKFTDAKKRREALGKKDYSWTNKKGEKPGINLGLSKDVDIIQKPGETVKQITKDKVVTPTVNKAKEIGTQVVNKAIEGGKTAVQGAVKNATNVAKAAAGPAVAGLAVSKGVDSLMKMGKKKDTKESFSNWRDELGYEGKDSSKKIDEDWQKVNRNDKTDGLSQKAVNAYRRENPGSKLKTAVTKDPKKLKKGSKSAKRRLSFCRRMKGMKKKLTSAKTSRDPDSRINKALRRWNCSYEPTGTTIAEKALSKKQQKFFGIVRAAQKGTLDGEASPQVQRAAADMKMKDVKKFASTKHKGLPEKVKSKE